jgi:murein DD-endopeptidase MepM/ murein hydrolase activator NlpD
VFQVKTLDIKILLWLFASILLALSALGFAGRAETLMSRTRPAAQLPGERTDEPLQAAHGPSAFETPPPPPLTSTSPLPGDSPMRPELAPPPTEPAPESLFAGRASGPKCPLSRVAMVRGSDSEASEGGGFYAARKNGIHGAVDLNGRVGESVFAVANGKVIVAQGRSDWGKLGKTVILDHLDGGYTVYGHLHMVEVKVNSSITAGDKIGTIGYSGNAASLQAKNLPPHLHFAYFRAVAGLTGKATPLGRIKDSSEGFRLVSAKDAIMADLAGILNPLWAVKFQKCWEDPTPAMVPSTPSTLAMP